MISHRFWTRMFAADPSVIGRTIRIETVELTVIGVTPEGFGGFTWTRPSISRTARCHLSVESKSPVHVASEVIGRLRKGVTLEAGGGAAGDVVAAGHGGERRSFTERSRGAAFYGNVTPRCDRSAPAYCRSARQLHAAVHPDDRPSPTLLLILMCVNVGGLLLTRLSARSNELALRLALGGSRYRVAQQLIVEGLLLSIAGTIVALPIAFARDQADRLADPARPDHIDDRNDA